MNGRDPNTVNELDFLDSICRDVFSSYLELDREKQRDSYPERRKYYEKLDKQEKKKLARDSSTGEDLDAENSDSDDDDKSTQKSNPSASTRSISSHNPRRKRPASSDSNKTRSDMKTLIAQLQEDREESQRMMKVMQNLLLAQIQKNNEGNNKAQSVTQQSSSSMSSSTERSVISTPSSSMSLQSTSPRQTRVYKGWTEGIDAICSAALDNVEG